MRKKCDEMKSSTCLERRNVLFDFHEPKKKKIYENIIHIFFLRQMSNEYQYQFQVAMFAALI